MPTPTLTFAELTAMDRDAITAALAGLFEGPPWIVVEAWDARPFASRRARMQGPESPAREGHQAEAPMLTALN